jgi:hypothetical protein
MRSLGILFSLCLVASCGHATSAPAEAPRAATPAGSSRQTREPTMDQLTCHDGRLPPLDEMPEPGVITPGIRLADMSEWPAYNEEVERNRRANDGWRECSASRNSSTAICGAPDGATGRRGRAIAEGACAVTSRVRACYDAVEKTNPSFAGTLAVGLTIDATGLVTLAKAGDGTASDPSFASCVEQAFAGASFPPSAQGSVTWRLTMRPPAHHMVKMIEAGTDIQGRLPPEVIKRIIRANYPHFRACYEQGLKRDATIEGIVRVAFSIRESGDVADVRDAGSTLKDPTVVACVVKVFETLSFPEPEGGKVRVIYPIDFQYTP